MHTTQSQLSFYPIQRAIMRFSLEIIQFVNFSFVCEEPHTVATFTVTAGQNAHLRSYTSVQPLGADKDLPLRASYSQEGLRWWRKREVDVSRKNHHRRANQLVRGWTDVHHFFHSHAAGKPTSTVMGNTPVLCASMSEHVWEGNARSCKRHVYDDTLE